jgi:uncharacterized protein YbjQ (UPF0145 family)
MKKNASSHRNIIKIISLASSFLCLAQPSFAQNDQSSYPAINGQGYTAQNGQGGYGAQTQGMGGQNFQTQNAASQYAVPQSSNGNSPWTGQMSSDIITTNTPNIEGYRITSYKGVIEGVSVRQPTWGQNMAANFQGMFGGSIEAYGQMCEQSRVQAYKNLIQRARSIGANAIVNIRFDSESLPIDNQHFATAVVCYGTAVSIEPFRR